MSFTAVYLDERGEFLIVPTGKNSLGVPKSINEITRFQWDGSSYSEFGEILSHAITISNSHQVVQESEEVEEWKAVGARSWRSFAKVRQLVYIEVSERDHQTIIQYIRRDANFGYGNTFSDPIYARSLEGTPTSEQLSHAVVDVLSEAGVERV
jgi:hypothetical protein